MTRSEAFFDFVDQSAVSDELKSALIESFAVIHESDILEEGVGDFFKNGMSKFGKAAAIGALALGAANANAAQANNSTAPNQGKATTTVTSKVHHNLWQNQKFQDRVDEITNQLVAAKEAANKPYSYDLLQSKAWDMALAELNQGKLK